MPLETTPRQDNDRDEEYQAIGNNSRNYRLSESIHNLSIGIAPLQQNICQEEQIKPLVTTPDQKVLFESTHNLSIGIAPIVRFL